MTLLGNRLLVRPLPQSDRTPDGIWLVEHTPNQMYFRVLQVGNGKGCKPRKGGMAIADIQAGDCIITHSFQGHQAELADGSKIIDAHEVLAVMRP